MSLGANVALSGIAAVLLVLTGCESQGLQVRPRKGPFEDRSFSEGRPVLHPEELSGVWEAPDGRGGAIGLNLRLLTTVPASVTSLVGIAQSWGSLQVGAYQRAGPALVFGEANWVLDSPRGGGVVYQDGRLRVALPWLDLDLKHEPDDTWVGRFHRKDFDQIVTLRRPGATPRTQDQWFLGTWIRTDPMTPRCMHLGREQEGAFVGWTDAWQVLGHVRYGPHAEKLHTAFENYGALATVTVAKPGSVTVNFDPMSGWCCPGSFEGFRQRNGVMSGEMGGPIRQATRETWRRVEGVSCVAAAGRRVRQTPGPSRSR